MTFTSYTDELKATAKKLATKGKGILAVDESTPTFGKRLASIGVENTEENRQAYRGMLFTTPDLGKYISGAILFEETLYQNHADGEKMVEKLNQQGIIPGIKVDKGLKPLYGADPGETYCSGFDGLTERAAEYYKAGARFAKWRSVIQIELGDYGLVDPQKPSPYALHESVWGLAKYARAVQEAGLVPIIEPEILMDGDHELETCKAIQSRLLQEIYWACGVTDVYLEGTLLKPSMTVPGTDCKDKSNPKEIAETTIEVMKHGVPLEVPGIVFLSGGLSEEAASVYLNEMNQLDTPWNVSFSYGRALQHSCLKAWGGSNIEAGQSALLARAQANSEASKGEYVTGSQPSSDEELFVAGYTY